MGKYGINNGNERDHDAKRQRISDSTTEQRTAFAEDMARIRSAAAMSGGAAAGGSSAARLPVPGVGVSDTTDAASDRQQRQQNQCSGESTLQQQQSSGESSLQQQQQQHQHQPTRQYYLQPQPPQHPHATNSTGDVVNEGSDSEEEEEDGGGNWLKNFTPHHARVGANYQVTNLPTAPPAVSGSCVSPGGVGGV